MSESADRGAGDQNAQADANSHVNKLPMVLAPRLGAGEHEAFDDVLADDVTFDDVKSEAAAESAESDKPAAAPPSAPVMRFLMLAASVAFAAAFGSFVGSMSGSGLAFHFGASSSAAGSENVSEAIRTMKLEIAELATIKASLETASRSTTTQIAKISDRLDHLDPHNAAVEQTGSISNAPASTDPPKITDRIMQDWIVQDVQNGRALVESRSGAMFEIGAGSTLPGVGHVDAVRRQDGQWVVITARGTIMSGR
jgi:hypothetical protein